jgi:hypothetical protein
MGRSDRITEDNCHVSPRGKTPESIESRAFPVLSFKDRDVKDSA